MQSAADAAAMAGADALATGACNDSTLCSSASTYAQAATDAAKAEAARNGFTDGAATTASSNKVMVAVYNPPASGPYAANSSAVQVVISQQQPTFFMRVLGSSTVKISTVATGATVSSGSCVYGLDPTASGAITIGGGGYLTSPCGVYDDSNNSSALIVSGGGVVQAPIVGVVGGTNLNGGGSTSPTTGIAAFGDPLAWIQAPAVGICSTLNTNPIGGTVTLSQGTYCGGIKINSGANVTFSPGTYVIKGGGLTVLSSATVNGSGVTFYFTGGNKADSNPSSYGGVNIAGNSTVNLSAPCDSSSGGIPYMLFFQDRADTNGAASSINGGSTSSFSGAIYFPTTALSYAGNSGASQYTLLVADTLNITGATNMGNSYCSGGSPIQTAALVQ
jgi:hypothetical protein